MASITSLGIGSGIDLNGMVSQLVAIERRPIVALQGAANKINTQISSLGRLQSLMSTLQDAANKLTSTSLWSGSKASSSDAATVDTVGNSSASAGTYAVTVQSLAAPQTLVSGTVFPSSSSTVGSGTLTIGVGTWNSALTNFSQKSGTTPVSISIGAGDTLVTVRDKINAAGGGVFATVINDATGARLSLRSTNPGVDNGFQVKVTDGDGTNGDATGLSRLAFDPPSAGQMTLAQAASNTKATVNGVQVESTTAEISGVVDGLTLRAQRITASPVNVTVVADDTSVKAAVKSFADAYSALSSFIADQTKYDPNSKASSPLQGDTAVSSVLNRMRALVNSSGTASSSYTRLSDIGLQVQRDGSLSVNDSKLDAAIANRAELRKALTNLDQGNEAGNGFARRFATMASDLVGNEGAISTRTEGLRKKITRNTQQQELLQDRVDSFQKRLEQQFTGLDKTVSKFKSLDSYLSQQLEMLRKNT